MEKREMGEYALAIFRIAVGYMMLWGFLDKMFGLGYETPAGGALIDGVSPSSYVTWMTGGIFGDLFDSIAGNAFIDFLMMAGMLVMGITLVTGIASKLTTIFMGMFLLVMYCIHVPPTDNPILDYHITWIITLAAVYLLGGFDRLSLNARWKELGIVKRFRILE